MVGGASLFNLEHILSLLIAIAINVALFFLLRNASTKCKVITLGILSFSGISAVIYNLVEWGSPIEYLPLHMCSINALLLPFAVFTRNKTLGNLLILWCAGALLALVVPATEYEALSVTYAFYLFPHALELGIPILLFALKLVKLDMKCIISTLIITLAIYTLVHFINVILNNYCVKNNIVDNNGDIIVLNYMFSLDPQGNPILSLMWKLIPYEYWYMYAAFPLCAVVLAIAYLPSTLLAYKRKKA